MRAYALRGRKNPQPNELLTGAEYASRYLEPLAQALGSVVQTQTEVVAIGREGTRKTEKIGAPDRGETPFRLLLRTSHRERFEQADHVFDCSGTFSSPNPVGDGGLPAIGEAGCSGQISYGVVDAPRFDGKRLLVVGAGHSAATAVRDLVNAGAAVTWAVRHSDPQPCRRIPNDPLPERDRLSAEANALLGIVAYSPATTVQAVERTREGLRVSLQANGYAGDVLVDHIVAATGFRPDLNLARELQVQTCWATEGTYKLAAALLGETGGDCLAIPSFGADALTHPEPGFYTLGMKSYGRTPAFLIRTGREQIASVLAALASRQ